MPAIESNPSTRHASRLSGVAWLIAAALAILPLVQPAAAAVAPEDISVVGLPDVASGEIKVEVRANAPVAWIRMKIPGVVERIEEHAPYALMGDADGELLPLDTTAMQDGAYTLHAAVRLSNGDTVTRQFDFEVDNSSTSRKIATELEAIGLPDVAKGEIFVRVRPNGSIEWMRLILPGVVKRIESSAPYSLMGDDNGKLNPLDTTTLDNGTHTLTAVARLANGDSQIGRAHV